MSSLRIAVRTLLKSRGFTLAAVLILAVGIGAATVMFSVVDGIVLRPLPYRHPGRLVLMWESPQPYRYTSPADFLDWRRLAHSFDGLAAFGMTGMNLSGTGAPVRLRAMSVSGNLFTLLGVRARYGRTFLPADDRPGAPREVLLSHDLWQQRFASDPSVAGRTIRLNNQPYTVVGVMPEGFQFDRPVDVWTLGIQGVPATFPFPHITTVRDSWFFSVVGRLKPGVTQEQAAAEMRTISRRLEAAYPDTNKGRIAQLLPLRTAFVGDIRPALLVLLGAVAFLLVLACANVANLLLVRAAGRRREIGIRIALGAERRHLLVQLLTESLLLALTGAALGLLLTAWGVDALKAIAPAGTPRLAEVGVDLRVLLFAVGTAVVTGTLFGLAPAMHLTAAEGGADALKSSGTRTTDSRGVLRLRDLLVTGEIAVAEVLLIGAGLLLVSFTNLTAVRPGFNPGGLLTFNVTLPANTYPNPADRTRFYHDLLARLQALPGVSSAGATMTLPVAGGRIDRDFWIEGRPSNRPGGGYSVDFQMISDRYFQTMQIPLMKGRIFNTHDDLHAPPVAIISGAMARKYWPNQNPIGRRIGLGSSAAPDYWHTIVGIVGDIRQGSLQQAALPQVYVPYAQNKEPWPWMAFAVRTGIDPRGLERAVRAQVAAIDPDQPVAQLQTMAEALSASTRRQQFNLWLLGLFAGVALLLAAAGVYSVRAYAVASRTQEIGVRMALGAGPRAIARLVVWQGAASTAAGVVLGLGGALALGRTIRSLLFDVAPADPATFAAVTILLAFVSLAAAAIPARRAARVDPVVALREE